MFLPMAYFSIAPKENWNKPIWVATRTRTNKIDRGITEDNILSFCFINVLFPQKTLSRPAVNQSRTIKDFLNFPLSNLPQKSIQDLDLIFISGFRKRMIITIFMFLFKTSSDNNVL
jgi:hypothetical protein